MRRKKLPLSGVAALLMTLCLLPSGCVKLPPAPRKKAIFIFCDVTGSLIKPESDQVAKLAADILDRLPPGAVYRLLPVHMNTGNAEPFLETQAAVNSKEGLGESDKEDRRNKIKAEVDKWYDIVNAPERKPERTCLLAGLARAREFFANLEGRQYDYELVFISDMIEDCQNTPAGPGKTISLLTQTPAVALGLIEKAPLPDLANVNITIIIPGKNERTAKNYGVKPSKETLHTFWAQVFRKCLNEGVSLDDWFTATVPEQIFQTHTVQSAD